MLGSLGKLTELRQRIFFVIGALVVSGWVRSSRCRA